MQSIMMTMTTKTMITTAMSMLMIKKMMERGVGGEGMECKSDDERRGYRDKKKKR